MTHRLMTAANLRAVLADAGATDAVVELAVRLTAPGRHAARVEDAMYAALKYVAGGEFAIGAVEAMVEAVDAGKSSTTLPRLNYTLSNDCWALAAAAHCAIEAWVGRGGPCGAGGPGRSTDRAPWAQMLGKGRHLADDGAAWDAALADASRMLARAAGAPDSIIVLEPTGEGLRACAPGASVLLDFDSPKQAYALCLRGLAEALPVEAPHRLAPLAPECNLRFVGALDEWARTLDHIGLMGADASIREGDSPLFAPWAGRAVDARLETLRRDASEATSA
jgi:hypothetical protein